MPDEQPVASSESTQPPTPTPPAQTPAVQGDPDGGAGGKRQLLADLAKERDERQALAAQIETMGGIVVVISHFGTSAERRNSGNGETQNVDRNTQTGMLSAIYVHTPKQSGRKTSMNPQNPARD